MTSRQNPNNRINGPADPDGTMLAAVEAWIESQSDWLGDEEGVMVTALRRFGATCDEHPHLVTAHREVAVLTKQLLARKPVEDETEPSALASILEKAGNLRAV